MANAITDAITDAAASAVGDLVTDQIKPSETRENDFNNIFSPASLKRLNKTLPKQLPKEKIVESEYGFMLNGVRKSFQPGLTVLIGGTGSGKSTFFDFQITGPAESPVRKLLYKEPIENLFSEGFELAANAAVILDRLSKFKDKGGTIFIDSISDDFKTVKGGSGKEGLSHESFEALTVMNNFCLLRGICMVASLNPGYLSSIAYDAVHDAVAGKVGSVIKFASQPRGLPFEAAEVAYDVRPLNGKRSSSLGMLNKLDIVSDGPIATPKAPVQIDQAPIQLKSVLGKTLSTPTMKFKD